jgi:hypothetical protein
MTLVEYAKRYVVPIDPIAELAAFPPEVRSAILAGHIRRAMTREQVVMAVGYPITSENPRLDASTWRYWRSMNDEFQVL